MLPFVTTFNPATPISKKDSNETLAPYDRQRQTTVAQTYPNAPVVAYRKKKSLKVFLVRAKISAV